MSHAEEDGFCCRSRPVTCGYLLRWVARARMSRNGFVLNTAFVVSVALLFVALLLLFSSEHIRVNQEVVHAQIRVTFMEARAGGKLASRNLVCVALPVSKFDLDVIFATMQTTVASPRQLHTICVRNKPPWTRAYGPSRVEREGTL